MRKDEIGMSLAKKYLDILRKREPQLWKKPWEKSALTQQDLSEIEAGLGYSLPMPYREFLLSYQMPDDITVLVSFCGDAYANSWAKTFSREKHDYVPRPPHDIGPTVEFEWHNIAGNNAAEFLANLREEQGMQDGCPCFLEAGFIELGEVYGYLTYLDLVKGGIVTIHEEGVYDMMLVDGVDEASKSEVRAYMESQRLYICKDFDDFLRFVCTGDFLDEDEARFPTQEELERDYSY